LRFVRSALRAADRFVSPSTGLHVRLKPSQLGNLFHNLKGSFPTAKSLSTSTTTHIPSHAHRAPPIQNSFSLPTRFALNRPLSAPHLPRPPMVPRSVTQVGLGTARNFSSSRHVFQNIIDNVPITTRALWEAEWDLKKAQKDEKRKMRKMKKENAAAVKVADKLKAKSALPLSVITSADSDVDSEVSPFSHYFPTPAPREEAVTTVMEIPLYPAAERLPLPGPPDPSNFMPLQDIRAIHDTHSLHALRVSTIFKRLDAADVWSRGAECQCYGVPFGSMVTTLRVTFTGWTREMVLEVIGEAGKGWCSLEEERAQAASPDPEPVVLPLTESLPDSTISFVLPTLDFSSDFATHVDHVPSGSTAHSFQDWTPFTTRPSSPSISFGSDEEYDSDGSVINFADYQASPRIQQSLGFSVDFLSRGSHFDDTLSL